MTRTYSQEMVCLNKDPCDYEDVLKDTLFYKDTLLAISLSDLTQPLETFID